jgi:hypothetical protein
MTCFYIYPSQFSVLSNNYIVSSTKFYIGVLILLLCIRSNMNF